MSCDCESKNSAPVTMTITCDLNDPDGRSKAYHIGMIDHYVMGYYDVLDLHRKLFNGKHGNIDCLIDDAHKKCPDAIPYITKVVDMIDNELSDIIETSRFRFE